MFAFICLLVLLLALAVLTTKNTKNDFYDFALLLCDFSVIFLALCFIPQIDHALSNNAIDRELI